MFPSPTSKHTDIHPQPLASSLTAKPPVIRHATKEIKVQERILFLLVCRAVVSIFIYLNNVVFVDTMGFQTIFLEMPKVCFADY